MRHLFSGGLAAAALGTALVVAGAMPASAQVARFQPNFATVIDTNNSELFTLVRKRGGGGGGRASRGGRGGGGYGRGGRGGGRAFVRSGGRGDRGGIRARSNRGSISRNARRNDARVMRASRNDSDRVSRASRSGDRIDRSDRRRFDRADRRRWDRWDRRRWANRWHHRHHSGYWRDYAYWGSGIGLGLALTAPYYAYRPVYYTVEDWETYCRNTYESYDPVSRTYLGFDSLRHSCP